MQVIFGRHYYYYYYTVVTVAAVVVLEFLVSPLLSKCEPDHTQLCSTGVTKA
jgi:bacteriorhodopsin